MAKYIRTIVPIKVEKTFAFSFGITVEKYARKAGILQEELAVRANCSADYMQKIFSGSAHTVRLSHILKVAEALDMPLSDLVYEAETTDYTKHRNFRDRWLLAGGALNPRNKQSRQQLKLVPPPPPPHKPKGGGKKGGK